MKQLITNIQIELVETFDGRSVPIRWIGRQTVNTVLAEVPERMQLVRIAAGALGDDLPKRELKVTADHAMYVEG